MFPEINYLPQWIPEPSAFRSGLRALLDRFSPIDYLFCWMDEQPVVPAFAIVVRPKRPVMPSTPVQAILDGNTIDVPVAETLYDVYQNPMPVAVIADNTVLILNLEKTSGSYSYTDHTDYWTIDPPTGALKDSSWYIGYGRKWRRVDYDKSVDVLPDGPLHVVYTPQNYLQRISGLQIRIDGVVEPHYIEQIWSVLEEWRLRYTLDRRPTWTNDHLQLAIQARRHALHTIAKPWWGICADLCLLTRVRINQGYTVISSPVVDLSYEKRTVEPYLVVLDDVPITSTRDLYPDVLYWVDGDEILDSPVSIASIGVGIKEPVQKYVDGGYVYAVRSDLPMDAIACTDIQWDLHREGRCLVLWDMVTSYIEPTLMDVLEV